LLKKEISVHHLRAILTSKRCCPKTLVNTLIGKILKTI